MRFQSLIKRGDYPLVANKYNVDFYSDTLDEKIDETCGDIWRHFIYGKPEPKGLSEIIDTGIVRALIENELNIADYDTDKRTNSTDTSPDGQRTGLPGNTPGSPEIDVPTGDRKIPATKKETSDNINDFIAWITEKYPDEKYTLNVRQLCTQWINYGCRGSFNAFLNEQYHQHFVPSCAAVGLAPPDFKTWLLRPLECDIVAYSAEVQKYLAKHKVSKFIEEGVEITGINDNPYFIEELFNKAFILINSDEIRYDQGVNYYYLFNLDNKYYKSNSYPFQTRRTEDFSQAIPLFSEVIKHNPVHSFSYLFRGYAKYRTQDIKGAIEDYNKYIGFESHDEVVWFIRGLANATSGNYKEAIEDNSKSIKIMKSYWRYPFLSAYKIVFLDREGKFFNHYEKIPVIPELDELYYARARAYLKLKEYNNAIDDLNKALAIEPNYKTYIYYRGTAKHDIGDYQGAIADYSKVLELDPKDAVSYFERGKTFLVLDEFVNAVNDFNTCYKLKPDHDEVLRYRGDAKTGVKDFKGAVEDYDKAILLNPHDSNLYCNRGLAKVSLGNIKEAITDYNKALEIDPNECVTLSNRGLAKTKLGEYQSAIEDFNRALEIEPNKSEVYSNRALSKIFSNDLRRGMDDLNTAIELDPNNNTAFANRGALKLNLKDFNGAIHDFNKAIELDPTCAILFYNRYKAKHNLNDVNGAAEDYNRAVSIDPGIGKG